MRVGMPKIFPIIWVNEHYGYQRVSLQHSKYIKIWKSGFERKVVDTALTIPAAKKRIRSFMENAQDHLI